MKKRILKPTQDITKRTAPRNVVLQAMNCYILGPGAQSGSFRSSLIDISATGAQIYTARPMDEHTEIALEIKSKDGSQALNFTGIVVWARKNAMRSMGRYAYGLKFISPGRDHMAFVAENFIQPNDSDTP